MKSKSINVIRNHIKHSGKIGFVLCQIIIILLIIYLIIHGIALIYIYINNNDFYAFRWIYENNSLYRLITSEKYAHFWNLGEKNILDGLEPKYQAMVGIGTSLITWSAILFFTNVARQFMAHLASEGRPFSVRFGRKMRVSAFLFLFLLFYNPLLGIISFGLTLFLSYIMEYGGLIQEQADETTRIQEEVIFSFAEITENKSGQTGQHIKRVSEYSEILAEQLGLPAETCEQIRIASTMHDVGKLMIPSEILDKPGKLTNEEYAVIKTHTTYGGKLLENVEGDVLKLSRTIAMQHHERYDGKGYPSGIAGEEISLEGRIVSVADVYDALTSRRSYKEAWDEKDAYQEILKGKGTQFDPQVVDAFETAHDKILTVQEQFSDQ